MALSSLTSLLSKIGLVYSGAPCHRAVPPAPPSIMIEARPGRAWPRINNSTPIPLPRNLSLESLSVGESLPGHRTTSPRLRRLVPCPRDSVGRSRAVASGGDRAALRTTLVPTFRALRRSADLAPRTFRTGVLRLVRPPSSNNTSCFALASVDRNEVGNSCLSERGPSG